MKFLDSVTTIHMERRFCTWSVGLRSITMSDNEPWHADVTATVPCPAAISTIVQVWRAASISECKRINVHSNSQGKNLLAYLNIARSLSCAVIMFLPAQWLGLHHKVLADLPKSASSVVRSHSPLDKQTVDSLTRRLQSHKTDEAQRWIAELQKASNAGVKCDLEALTHGNRNLAEWVACAILRQEWL